LPRRGFWNVALQIHATDSSRRIVFFLAADSVKAPIWDRPLSSPENNRGLSPIVNTYGPSKVPLYG